MAPPPGLCVATGGQKAAEGQARPGVGVGLLSCVTSGRCPPSLALSSDTVPAGTPLMEQTGAGGSMSLLSENPTDSLVGQGRRGRPSLHARWDLREGSGREARSAGPGMGARDAQQTLQAELGLGGATDSDSSPHPCTQASSGPGIPADGPGSHHSCGASRSCGHSPRPPAVAQVSVGGGTRDLGSPGCSGRAAPQRRVRGQRPAGSHHPVPGPPWPELRPRGCPGAPSRGGRSPSSSSWAGGSGAGGPGRGRARRAAE